MVERNDVKKGEGVVAELPPGLEAAAIVGAVGVAIIMFSRKRRSCTE